MAIDTPLLQAAIRSVSAACRITRGLQSDLERLRGITKDDRSPVTVADYAVQAIVALALRERAGEVLIVGEEHAGFLRQLNTLLSGSTLWPLLSAIWKK